MEAGQDPLRPLVSVTRALSRFIIAVLVLGVLAMIFGGGRASLLGLGDNLACVTTTELPVAGSDPQEDALFGLKPGVSKTANQLDLCQEHADGVEQALVFLTSAPEFVLLLGFLGGVRLLVRRAGRAGLFSRPVADGVRLLGWWVLAGGLAVATVQALAASSLIARMVTGEQWFNALPYWSTSMSGFIAGAGLLTIAKVMKRAVSMQTELDAVV